MKIDLSYVINWIENDCDKKEAIKELRLYQKQIDFLVDILAANERIVGEQKALLLQCRDMLNLVYRVDLDECESIYQFRHMLNSRYID